MNKDLFLTELDKMLAELKPKSAPSPEDKEKVAIALWISRDRKAKYDLAQLKYNKQVSKLFISIFEHVIDRLDLEQIDKSA